MHQLKARSVELDAIVVPVSGGGMISGIAMAAKTLNPSIKVIAAEPLGTNGVADVATAKRENRIVECPKTLTIADGLQARLVTIFFFPLSLSLSKRCENQRKVGVCNLFVFQGPLTWPIVRDYVDEVVTVEEHEIATAMRKVSAFGFSMIRSSQTGKQVRNAHINARSSSCHHHHQVLTGLKVVVEPSGAVVRAIEYFPPSIVERIRLTMFSLIRIYI